MVQCSRPRQAHSKDLHSTIVAAFHCCKTWILHHPYLLQDKDCIATVLEVIELGISGTKSQAKTTEPVVMKDKKISQPASRRVKERFCILILRLRTCPRTFLNCFVLNTLSSKAKQLRNVLGRKN